MFTALGPHASFIIWSYVIGFVLTGGLAWWIIARQRAAKRRLETLESTLRAERRHG